MREDGAGDEGISSRLMTPYSCCFPCHGAGVVYPGCGVMRYGAMALGRHQDMWPWGTRRTILRNCFFCFFADSSDCFRHLSSLPTHTSETIVWFTSCQFMHHETQTFNTFTHVKPHKRQTLNRPQATNAFDRKENNRAYSPAPGFGPYKVAQKDIPSENQPAKHGNRSIGDVQRLNYKHTMTAAYTLRILHGTANTYAETDLFYHRHAKHTFSESWKIDFKGRF
jgi:hypothetical protein